MLVRELAQNSRYDVRVVGFLDDDAGKRGRTVRGVPIVGGFSYLESALTADRPDALILSADGLDPHIVAGIREACGRLDVRLFRFRCSLEELPSAGFSTDAEQVEEQAR